jgi:hypothetical protein
MAELHDRWDRYLGAAAGVGRLQPATDADTYTIGRGFTHTEQSDAADAARL